jgi:hypothetical protein
LRQGEGKLKEKTSNAERPTPNLECRKEFAAKIYFPTARWSE